MGKYRPAIPTMSLGHGAAGHALPTKLRAAKKAGFEGVEMFYACLQHFAESQEGVTERDRMREAARKARALCDELGLEVMVLQPTMNYEGILDKEEHELRVEDIRFRMELCKLLGTDMMQIPATFRIDEGVTGDEAKIVADLQEVADIGLEQSPPIRFAYESMCWSTYSPTWQKGWNIVQKVDRPNFGILLDAFHIAGYEYADPTAPGCVRPDGAERLAVSLKELVETFTVPANRGRIFYVEVADAERLDLLLAPIGEKSESPYHVDGQHPRMSWSRNCRLFMYEEDLGGFLPVEQIAKAFLETGFSGWISPELFTRHMNDSDSSIPSYLATRAEKSWLAMKKNLKL